MAVKNPFYSQVPGATAGAIGARGKYYASEDRSVPIQSNGNVKRATAFDWLYKKMAWATASAEAGGSLGLIKGGGIGPDSNGTNIPGLYTTSPRTGTRAVNNGKAGSLKGDAARFVPRPHLTAVKISCVGDLGSIRKTEINFTVYTRGQLSSVEGFFALGKGVTIKYGWAEAGGAGGPVGYFKGTIYNFNYSLNADGGYDCTSYAMGEGLNVLTPNATAPMTGTGTASDPAGIVVNATGILSQIKVDKLNAASLVKNTVDRNSTGIGVVEFSEDWATAKDSTEDPAPAQPATTAKQATKHYYVSLERIVGLINTIVITNSSKYNGLKLVCNVDVTVGLKPSKAPFVSADPTKVLFPGYGNYGMNAFAFDAYEAPFLAGDLSKAMINTDYVSDIFADMGRQFIKTKKPGDYSIANFLGRIFALINQCSGGLYKLTCVQDSDNPKLMLILDADAIPSGVIPLSLNAVSQNGVCRSVSLVSKVPSDMATVAFVDAQSSLTAHQPKAFEAVNSDKKVEKPKASVQPLPEVLKALDEGGCTPANVSALQAALEAARSKSIPAKIKGYSASTIIPLEFSATLDGIEGFHFGNIVTTNVMPAKYYDKAGSKVVFCITTIDHNISGNDWTTTINTVCRLRID
jgi:hypothetical protein